MTIPIETIQSAFFFFFIFVQVLMNGHDIKSVTQQSVRRAIGVVPQDTVMFNDTVLHNVRYGKMDASMTEVCTCKSRSREGGGYNRTTSICACVLVHDDLEVNNWHK